MTLIPVRDAWGRPADFRYEDVNDPAAEWIGLPVGLLVGRTLREVFSPTELAPLLPPLLSLCETGEPWIAPELTAADDGRRVSLRAEMREGRIALTFRRLGLPDAATTGRGVREVEAVRRVAGAVGAGLSQDEVYRLLREILADLYGAGSVAIARLDEAGRIQVLTTALERIRTLPPGEMPLAVAIATNRTARCDDHSRVDDPVARRLLEIGLRASLAAPVSVGGVMWGALAIATPEPAPAGAEATLEAMATLVGIMQRDVDRRLRAGGGRGAVPLGGPLDHAAFRDRLARAWEDALGSGRPLSLAVLDVDHLSAINQGSGHAAGDAVLSALAGHIRSASGDAEPARIGGGQFAWIMPGVDAVEATHLAGLVRRDVAAERLAGVGGVTVSAGIAEMRQASRPAELLRLAEGALSWAKTHGRDLVLAYDPAVVEAFSAAEWAERLERDRTVASIEALARVVDAKDRATHEHSERVGAIAGLVAAALGWAEDHVALVTSAGRVHDVGKIGVPDEILLKPGPLTESERTRIRMHAEIGARIVSGILGDEQVRWVRHHHERWDGAGYPDRLAGDAIPEGARVLALADAFDVMRSARPYGATLTLPEALDECRRCAGTQFWPAAVDALLSLGSSGSLPR